MEKISLKERASKKIADWKNHIDQLEDQLEHSQDEAVAFFEKQKSNLANWIDEVKEEVDQFDDYNEERVLKLKQKLEELRLQATLGKADAKDALLESQKKLTASMHDVKLAIAGMEKNAVESTREVLGITDEVLDDYQAKFDMFRVQLNLGKKELVQTWEEKKKIITGRIAEMKARMKKAQEDSDAPFENFSKEIGEAWVHIKKAINL